MLESALISEFSRFYMSNISDEAIDLFSKIVKLKKYKTGDVLINKGTSKFYIIIEGIVATFSKNSNKDREYIRTIHLENYAFTDLFYQIDDLKLSHIDLDKKLPEDYYRCITACTLLEGDFNDFIDLSTQNHEISLLYNKVNQTILLQILKRLDRLSLLDATDRYKILKERIPQIENLIPQYQIASYLNITPVQLSRIRKKLYSK
ncbi:Crp/Fnr family transcriptional regulator [Tenacibaculum sp. MEBiC06402]|uniref:Crp/Fnr family transcriptional regulator n=1 Tax=unclassified Tenacibaculum TaxID=2635139 RepID=UPI003B9C227A